jgi:hypothetical protein
MADVLMVCVRQDVVRAKALAEMFLSAGFSIGDSHASDAALRSSAAAILVWSHASVRSASFRDASRRAIRTGKALIVNLISPSSRPARIGCSPIFDLSRWGGAPDDVVLGPLRHAVASMVKELRAQVEHWRAIRHSDETSAFVDYLARYGLDAAFSDAAEQRLDEIAFDALVGARAPGARLEPVAEGPDLRTGSRRRRMNAPACKAQTNDHSSPRGGASRDERAAPDPPASKRRPRSLSSRSAKSSGEAREREFGVGLEAVAVSREDLWSPQNRNTERNEPSRPHIEDAPRIFGVERIVRVEKAVRASVAGVALDLRMLLHWVVARFGSLRVAGLGWDRRGDAQARAGKVGAAPENMRHPARAGGKARRLSPPRRATAGTAWSMIESAIVPHLMLARHMTRQPIAVASLVAGAALAGALLLTGAASNMGRSDARIAIEDAKPGDVVFFTEPESTESAAAPRSGQAPLPARRAADRRQRTTTTSPLGPAVAASPISMNADDASASAASTDVSRVPSDTESLLSSGSLATETFAFDLAPHLPQSAETGATTAIGAAYRSANAIAPPALGAGALGNEILGDGSRRSADLALSAEGSAYCPDTARRADADLREPLATGVRVPKCIGR